MRQALLAIAFLQICCQSATARTDIRGVAVGDSLDDAMDYLSLDGARCEAVEDNQPVTCKYDEDTKMVMRFTRNDPKKILQVSYFFKFGDLKKMKAKLRELYKLEIDGLKEKEKITPNEELFVSLNEDGKGLLSIANASDVSKDTSTKTK